MYKNLLYSIIVGATVVLCLLRGNVFGQDYIDYQKTINRIDEDIIANDFNTATIRFDSIYNGYEFVFATHCIKALQICCDNNDSVNADKWLVKCFKQGVPLWIIRVNELTKKVTGYSTTQHTLAKYDSLRAIYKASINIELAKQIDSLMTIDQRKTRNVNDGFVLWRYIIYYPQWLRNNKKQFKILDAIIDEYGFPGERLIGLPREYEDSAALAKNILFYGPHLSDNRAYIMLIHYYTNPRRDINDKLYKDIINGCLPAYQYGALNDFMAKYGKSKYGKYNYYNVWHTDPDINNTDSINHRRGLIGLCTYENDQRNKLLWREQRKNKTANAEIILD